MIIRWIVLSIALLVTKVISVPIFAVLIALTIVRGIINLYQSEAERASKEREAFNYFDQLSLSRQYKQKNEPKEEHDN